MKECKVQGCGRVEYLAHGFCDKHYKRWRKTGDPLKARPSIEERFWVKVNRTEACWLWTGAVDHNGYGAFKAEGRARKAQQVAYELLVGEIPAGQVLDHLCCTPSCVNPSHLEPVTQAENTRRAVRRKHPDRDSLCVELHRQGLNQAQIAARVGMHPANVSRVLHRCGIQTPGRRSAA